jgi:hypothetical protein
MRALRLFKHDISVQKKLREQNEEKKNCFIIIKLSNFNIYQS